MRGGRPGRLEGAFFWIPSPSTILAIWGHHVPGLGLLFHFCEGDSSSLPAMSGLLDPTHPLQWTDRETEAAALKSPTRGSFRFCLLAEATSGSSRAPGTAQEPVPGSQE